MNGCRAVNAASVKRTIAVLAVVALAVTLVSVDAAAAAPAAASPDNDGFAGLQGPFSLKIDLPPSPPHNDNFANADFLTGTLPIVATGSSANATAEPGEPQPLGPGGSSIWFRWTPAVSEPVFIETCAET